MKHIVDHPRTRSEAGRLTRYSKLDIETGAARSREAETLDRQPRARRDGETLRRFAEIDRRDD